MKESSVETWKLCKTIVLKIQKNWNLWKIRRKSEKSLQRNSLEIKFERDFEKTLQISMFFMNKNLSDLQNCARTDSNIFVKFSRFWKVVTFIKSYAKHEKSW